jgi:PAS domain S-box-containing protein
MIDDDELAPLLEESAEELYEHAPAAYLSSLANGTIVKVNQTLLDWTGYARDDIVGHRRVHDLLAPGARIYYETHYAPLLQMQGSVREIAVEIVRADGTRLPVLMNSTAVTDDRGRPRVVRTTIFDASDRRRYERELLRARNEAELRARSSLALDHVYEAVVLLDQQGRVEVLNPSAERIFGVEAATVTGKPAADVLEGWEAVGAVPSGACPEVVLARHGVQEQWLAVAAVDAGDGVVYTIRDVTSDHRLEELRNELIAIVSHELRTPLTGAYGAAHTLLARGDQLDPGARQALLEMVVEQTRRLSGIVDQILTASRIDTGNVPTTAEIFDASDVVDPLVRDRGEEGARVVVAVPEGVLVRADLDRLRQVMTNLVENALKYAPGTVRVALVQEPGVARFTVSDDGPGIPASEHERIFEKFYRLDPDQRGGVSGIGLGLYIARELVTRMGGRIGLLPRERGTTFYVDVPLA